jgi:hypothetical protein
MNPLLALVPKNDLIEKKLKRPRKKSFTPVFLEG